MTKQVININEVKRLRKRLNEINSIPFDDILWYDDEKPIFIRPDIASEWKYIGLGNTMFITTDYYKEGEIRHEA